MNFHFQETEAIGIFTTENESKVDNTILYQEIKSVLKPHETLTIRGLDDYDKLEKLISEAKQYSHRLAKDKIRKSYLLYFLNCNWDELQSNKKVINLIRFAMCNGRHCNISIVIQNFISFKGLDIMRPQLRHQLTKIFVQQECNRDKDSKIMRIYNKDNLPVQKFMITVSGNELLYPNEVIEVCEYECIHMEN